MVISTELRPSIAPPISPRLGQAPTPRPSKPTARPWADGSTALFIDHVTKRFKLGRNWTGRTLDDDVGARRTTHHA